MTNKERACVQAEEKYRLIKTHLYTTKGNRKKSSVLVARPLRGAWSLGKKSLFCGFPKRINIPERKDLPAGKDPVSGLLRVRPGEVELAKVGHVEQGGPRPGSQALHPNLQQGSDVVVVVYHVAIGHGLLRKF